MWLLTKEAVVAIVRTAMPYVWAWFLTFVATLDGLTSNPVGAFLLDWINGVDPLAFAVIVGTVIYGAIRQLAEKFPWIGYFLVFNSKPSYSL